MSINKRYSDIVTPLNTKTIFTSDLLPPEIHVKVVIASMRQLVRLKEGKTAKIKDIPGFLAQCISSKVGVLCPHLLIFYQKLFFKVRQSPGTLIHVFIDEIPFSSFLDDNGQK